VRKLLAPAALALALTACDPDWVVHHVGWFSTMRHQRSIRPYTMPRPTVPGAVPVGGSEVDSLGLAAAERLTNPRTRTAESIERGKRAYETFCLVCHGGSGRGDGPIAAPNGPFFGVRSLVTDTVARRSDGYLYAVVIHAPSVGRGLMPLYGDKIHGTDRWDVVNYVRFLQGQAGVVGGKPR
jgi:mono/diheme cytochrome c family protein